MHSRKSDSTAADIALPMKPKLPLQLTCKLAALLFLAAVFAAGCVVHGHGRGHARIVAPIKIQPHVDVSVPAPVVFVFTDHHRHSVRSYYRDDHHRHGKKHKWRGKGRGRGHRPPGLYKHDVYPSGVHMQEIPHGLARQLPPPPHGTQFVYYSDQVLLVDIHTHVILDFIDISVGF